ncbi:hypothetical protein FOPE_10874 [Fonsecaea pedrosoi]|nr:hypothetical protein FOPE_10874 [Fonsecaea pedrosoi]
MTNTPHSPSSYLDPPIEPKRPQICIMVLSLKDEDEEVVDREEDEENNEDSIKAPDRVRVWRVVISVQQMSSGITSTNQVFCIIFADGISGRLSRVQKSHLTPSTVPPGVMIDGIRAH